LKSIKAQLGNVIGSSTQVALQLISLDVTIDSHPRLDRHARNVAKECNYDVRALRHVRGLLTDDVAQMIACIIVAHLNRRLGLRFFDTPFTRHNRFENRLDVCTTCCPTG